MVNLSQLFFLKKKKKKKPTNPLKYPKNFKIVTDGAVEHGTRGPGKETERGMAHCEPYWR
jgi:hypothetical protein